VRDVHACGFGRAVQIAGVSQFEGAPDGVYGAGVFKRQVVDVIGHHQESRMLAAAGMKKPQKSIRAEYAIGRSSAKDGARLGMRVNVGNGRRAWSFSVLHSRGRRPQRVRPKKARAKRKDAPKGGNSGFRARLATFAKVGFAWVFPANDGVWNAV